MKITYRHGDLFDGTECVVIHGTNTQGRFASGFAKIVRNKYPAAYGAYMDAYRTGNLSLGSINFVEQHGRLIVNAATQEFYGKDGKQYVSYDAVRSCFNKLNALMDQLKFEEVAMPLIGCGLGGGSWTIVSEIIQQESVIFTPVVYLHDGVIPTN